MLVCGTWMCWNLPRKTRVGSLYSIADSSAYKALCKFIMITIVPLPAQADQLMYSAACIVVQLLHTLNSTILTLQLEFAAT
jgi:hypothetical protein